MAERASRKAAHGEGISSSWFSFCDPRLEREWLDGFLLTFLEHAFDARTGEVHKNADGSVGHGEIRIGDSLIEISEARPEWPARPCSLHLCVPDTDAVYERAVAAGAGSLTTPENAPCGDRAAGVRDPAGNDWFIATRRRPGSSRRLPFDHAHA